MPSLTRLAAQLKDEKLLPSTNAEPTHPQPRSRLGRAPLRVDGRALRLFRIFVFDTYLCYTALCLLVDLVGWRYPSVGDGVVQWVFEGAQANAAAFEAVCPQQAPWVAPNGTIDVAYPENDILARRLSGAVKIDTSVHDDEPSPEESPEPWQRRFEPFRDYLAETYKKIHAPDGPVTHEVIHEHGLLYIWKGSDPSLKPFLLMAHQDVVPVDPETVNDWLEPPFSGNIVNNTVFGRGSTDAKAWLISIMSSVEALLDSDFRPRRTVLLSFGYDEEANGPYGAQHLAKRIEEIYGKDSLAMIVDEGNPVLSRYDTAGIGLDIAIPGVEEKGNAHMRLRIEGPGGHSSGPPHRTTIGLLSEIIWFIETRNPRHTLKEAVIPSLESAHLKTLQCARDSPVFSHTVKQALKNLDWATRSSFKEVRQVAYDRAGVAGWSMIHICQWLLTDRRRNQRIERAKKALLVALPEPLRLPFMTTQTPTVIHGGIKLNAIPPSVQVELDHRVGLHHTVQDVRDWYTKYVGEFAQTYNLAFSNFGQDVEVEYRREIADLPRAGKIFLDAAGSPLSPTPSTPTSGPDSAPWQLFSSVIRNVWQVQSEGGSNTTSSKPLLVAPSQMRGNTDVSHWYRPLSRHLFRFGPASLQKDPTPLGSAFGGVHGVSEHYNIDGLEKAARFYANLILAVDDSREL